MARRGINFQGISAAMIRDIRGFAEDRVNGVEEDLIEVSYEAAEKMQEIIASAESNTPTGLSEGRQGRVKTGAMHDAAGHVDITRGRTQVAARFGYRGEGSADYNYYQDNGFQHATAGRWIEGTHALSQAYMEAREKLHTLFMRRGLRGKGF
jgi:hypothetical protein